MKTLWKLANSPQVMWAHLAFWVFVNLLQWGFREQLSKVEWASWVQAVGSVAAITFAYAIGRQQAAATLQSVRDADKIAVLRKFDSVLAVVDSAHNYAKEISKSFSEDKVSYLHLRHTYSAKLMENMLEALQVIPAHELGSYPAVSALLTFRNAMHDFRGNVLRADAKLEATRTDEGEIQPVVAFKRTPVDLCLRKMEECLQVLHEQRTVLA